MSAKSVDLTHVVEDEAAGRALAKGRGMKRPLAPLAAFLLLLAACATAPKPKPAEVDPYTDPTVVGAVDEAARQGSIEAADAARAAKGVARAAGVLAAVLGGPDHESLDDTIDRYRRTRDAVETTSALIGAAHGVQEGAKRGLVFDQQFAELVTIDGLDVVRPYPDQLEVRFVGTPGRETLTKVVAVFAGRESRALDLKGPGGAALDIRESLIELGIPADSISAHRDDEARDVVMRVRYRD